MCSKTERNNYEVCSIKCFTIPNRRELYDIDYTIKDLSQKTQLPVEFLRKECSLVQCKVNNQICVIFPHYDENRYLQRYQIRNFQRRWWNTDFDNDSPIIPYGVWRLRDDTHEVYLTEGQTDTMTAWYKGLNALGIPGALSFKSEWTQYLLRYKRVIICPDNDPAGAKFAISVTEKLQGNKFTGDIKILHLPPGIKDLNKYFKQEEVEMIA